MTEMPTRREVFDAIRAEAVRTPDADHNGHTEQAKAADAATVASVLESTAYAHLQAPPEPQVGMKANPAQGHGGSPVAPTGSSGSLLDRLRANAAAALDAGPAA